MRPMRVMARINRRATNKLIGLWAPHLPPWAVLVHRGRKTGREYRTPVSAFVTDGSFAVPIGYGEESDWLRNILAAGNGELVRRGRLRSFTNPRIVDRGESGEASRITKRSLVADFVS